MSTIIHPHDRDRNPWNFKEIIEIDNYIIEYKSLGEICMGCPWVGSLAINGKHVDAFLFGGPFIKYKEYIYIPVYRNDGDIGRSFALYKLNLDTLHLKQISDRHILVIPNHIQDDRVYFYKSMEKKIITSVSV